ncbi:unnamed protein product [Rhizoctonia solani]|uniref:BTB domain-containing protein n=1 Tax=Rhizoctonia solani TaxID=456999 RepID=A0A8H3BX64_9AGAM|nr:unnamed protein product [Rhizoctonia solani]
MAKKKPATLISRGGSVIFTGKGSDTKAEDEPAEMSSTEPSESVIRHSEFFFDNTLIAIQIENTLFNVHKYQLVKSEVFSDMFKVPKPDTDEPEEGSSPEHPIIIEGVAAYDFTALLRVLYASHFSSSQPAPEAPLIIPAFRLANMFNFSELRAYLLPLAEKSLGDVDKIVFAREFDIKEWLVPAHVNLCKREERLSIEEARKLEVDSVLMISHMREQYQSRGNTTITGSYYCYGCTGLTYYGSGVYCKNCNNSYGYLRCDGPGTMASKATTTNEGENAIIMKSMLNYKPTVIFDKIENTLFNVHKYQLSKSEAFSDMFKLRKPEGDEPEEGSSPEHPIVIHGTTSSDFTALLKVLYASHFSKNQPTPEPSLIIPAFRLANLLNFSELRAYLLPLAEKSLNDVDKIVFARGFDIKDWLIPAHIQLCKRDEILSVEEARKLEVDSVLMISRMR